MTAIGEPGAPAGKCSEGCTWILHVDASLDQVNQHWAVLEAAGMVGAAEIDGRTEVYFPRRVPDLSLTGRWEQVTDRDWHEQWRAQLRPVIAGRWTITPSWLATGSAHEVVIDPGQAFGTGHHETTACCLEALAALPLHGRAVLDVGTGSGVLALAAANAGARVLALDTDPLAVDAARANARRNGVDLQVALGGIEVAAGRRFDVIVANLDTDTLARLATAFPAALALDGMMIASGVSNERADQAVAALQGVGLVASSLPGREWTLLRASLAPH